MTHPTIRATLVAALLVLVQIQALAAGREAPEKSRPCAVCHGPTGLSTLVNAPHLAGQPEGYLVEQLKAFRSGKRANEVMAVIAKPLSDSDIAELAAWYASIEIELKTRP
jgi:cytochrome c553